VSKKHSDLSVVTSDNPRTEDPEKIVAEIMKAFKLDSPPAEGGLPHVVTEVDRDKAIKLACFQAKPGDVVLIAGKGHENYQIVGTEKKDFDDFKLLQKYLR
jgi:UDP-N-acetylmuramoyl-L-alanyl-D-glutamate--2,6-diaminopimelate ligase